MATTSARPTWLKIEIAPKTIGLVLGVIASVWLLDQLTTVLSVVVIALILVGTFGPIVGWLERHGLRRGRALALVFGVAALALAGVVLLMVPPIVSQLAHLLADAPKGRDRLLHVLAGHDWATPIAAAVQDLPLDKITERAGTLMIGYSQALFIAIGYGLSTLFLAIYLLADPTRSKGFVYAVVPREYHVKLARIMQELGVIVGGYVRGQLITSLSIAVFMFVLLEICGADDALAIALFAGLTDVIPFVGGYVASAPVIAAVTPHGTVVTLIVLGITVLYQEFESRILIPRVYGRVLRLAPAIVLVALLVGGTLAGLLGALVALPIAAGLQMVIRELRVELPGAPPIDEAALRRDTRANEVYEQLSAGATAAAAGAIADDVATVAKRDEAAAAASEAATGDDAPA